MTRDDDPNPIMSADIYDCFALTNSEQGTPPELFSGGFRRLFGNEHIGFAHFTNAQVPGRLSRYDYEHFIIRRWYARTNIPETDHLGGTFRKPRESRSLREAFNGWAASVHVTLELGNEIAWRRDLDTLHRGRNPPPPWPIVVVPRQNVRVRVDSYDNRALDRFTNLWRAEFQPEDALRQALVWIHLDGISFEAPTGLEVDPVAEMVERLAAIDQAAFVTENRIADWVIGLTKEAGPDGAVRTRTDDAAVAEITAIHDAIREGQYR